MDSKDNFEDEINKEIQEGFIKQIADKIVQGMASLANATEDVKRRWIWELLQNAKDVPNRFGGVSVIIELYKDKLLFKHNGDCFTIKNLTSLIQQVSSKDDEGKDPNVTGKFGTGFITTHLLSRIFTIYGVAKSQTGCCKKFKMVVDRDADNSRDMIAKIKSALIELRELSSKDLSEGYEENRTEDDMDTTFEYPLDNETFEYANTGVKDLLNVLPYSLLFIPLLKKVTVFIHKDDGCEKTLVQRKGEIKGEGIEIITIVNEHQVFKKEKEISKDEKNSTFIMNSEGRLNIAWPITMKDDRTTITYIPLSLPKLFCSFPLIGSENFYQPMVINSGEFYPNEPRNTIFLRNGNTPQVKKNRELLVKANLLFKDLVKYAIDNGFEDFFNLFTPKPMNNDYIDHKWLIDSTYTPRIQFLYKEPLVKTVNGTQSSIKSMLFPKAATVDLRKELWELYRKYFHDNIVILEELESWYNVLSSTAYAYDIIEFVKKISESKCLSKMSQFDDTESRINFINELIIFIKKSDKSTPSSRVSLSDYPIIPNRKGNFVSQKRLLSDRENPIPDEIKEIYEETLGKSLDDILIHHSIKMRLNDYQKYDLTRALTEINTDLSKTKDVEKKKNISLMLTRLIPFDENEKGHVRYQIIEFMNNLDFEIAKKPLDNLPADMWRISDPVVFSLMLERLKGIGKSQSPKPVDLLARVLNKNVDGAMEWLNEYINFMRDNNFNVVVSSPIIPRQDGYFGTLAHIYVDEDIPQTIKNILSNGNYDIYSQLMDNRIKCFPGHQKMNTDTISEEILRQIDMKPPQSVRRGKNIYIPERNKPSNVYDITMKLICLQSEHGNHNRKEFFELIEPINFVELIPDIKPIRMEEELISSDILSRLNKCLNEATRFLAKYAIDEMEKKENINDIKSMFKAPYQQDSYIMQWYVRFINFIYTSEHFRRELLSNKIFLNQNGKFIKIDSASIDEDHDEHLLNIASNNLFNYDYKGIFVIPEIKNVLDGFYNGHAKKIHKEDIATFIDGQIKQIQNKGKAQDPLFVRLILEIRDLFMNDPSYKSLFPYTSEQMEQLILNTLNAETLSSIVRIVSEGNAGILSDLTDMSTDDIHQMMEFKKQNSSQTLTTINSLGDDDKQYLNDHPGELSRFIQVQRRNEREREEQLRNLEQMRLLRERRIREQMELLQNRAIPQLPVFQRPRNTIDHFRTMIMRQPVHFEPPPPPPKEFKERLKDALESLLQNTFKRVKEDDKGFHYYCSLVDDDDADVYLVLPLIADKEDEIDLSRYIVEYAYDNSDTCVIFVVPSEDNFDEETFKDDVKIITNIGLDLLDLNIVDTVSNLYEIENDNFSFKGFENYYVHVKNIYIDNNTKSYDVWNSSLQLDDK